MVATPFYRASELTLGGMQTHWLPRAQAFAQSAAELEHSVRTASSPISTQRLAWVRCMLDWERLAAVPVGAVLERRSVRTLDFWPTRTVQIQELRQSASTQEPALLASRVRAAGVGAKGLPALEWLLWRQANEPGTRALASRLCIELHAEATVLLQDYQARARAPEPEAVDEAQSWTDYGEWFTQCMGSLDQLRLKKLRTNTRGKDSAIWVRGVSGQTAPAWAAQWEGITHFLAGSPARRCGAANGAPHSFTDLLRSRGHLAPADRLERQLAVSQPAVLAANPNQPASVQRAQRALLALHTLASDMGSQLFDFSQGFTDADGD
ncbi:MAG: imelysin family protein [Rhodoferax sp.]|uniref:imelysin family protein n=2 Tax=Rhodoferax sp. TaxID=50421 RepID=UPI002ACE772B|nr:imelysin family protein [Rhodoferax sp.]MDZ7892562.1 imelysin family protein [Rhodoferax sp.]